MRFCRAFALRIVISPIFPSTDGSTTDNRKNPAYLVSTRWKSTKAIYILSRLAAGFNPAFLLTLTQIQTIRRAFPRRRITSRNQAKIVSGIPIARKRNALAIQRGKMPPVGKGVFRGHEESCSGFLSGSLRSLFQDHHIRNFAIRQSEL